VQAVPINENVSKHSIGRIASCRLFDIIKDSYLF